MLICTSSTACGTMLCCCWLHGWKHARAESWWSRSHNNNSTYTRGTRTTCARQPCTYITILSAAEEANEWIAYVLCCDAMCVVVCAVRDIQGPRLPFGFVGLHRATRATRDSPRHDEREGTVQSFAGCLAVCFVVRWCAASCVALVERL